MGEVLKNNHPVFPDVIIAHAKSGKIIIKNNRQVGAEATYSLDTLFSGNGEVSTVPNAKTYFNSLSDNLNHRTVKVTFFIKSDNQLKGTVDNANVSQKFLATYHFISMSDRFVMTVDAAAKLDNVKGITSKTGKIMKMQFTVIALNQICIFFEF